jgi:PIN domain nuclease of toxin-antitoxin system
MTEQETDTPEDPPGRPGVRAVLDASAILALLFGEPGAETVANAIADGAAMSTVTHAEVGTVLIRNGHDPSPLAQVTAQVSVELFTVADADTAAALIADGARLGLSLGDRACLALAKRLNAPALTAEQVWAQLDVGIEITLIRHAKP